MQYSGTYSSDILYYTLLKSKLFKYKDFESASKMFFIIFEKACY